MVSSRVVLTGFGSFSGVDVNPTEEIINHLRERESNVADAYHVLRVATTDVQEFCSKYQTDKDDGLIFVHLGVSGLASGVCLEECAYNNMTFRVPDEAGFQPQKEQICCSSPLESPLRSDLPLTEICNRICSEYENRERLENAVIATSTDPGRYLCNYIYYNSLQHFASSGKPKNCVFIHVPPVSAMRLEIQIALISRCTELIRDSCDNA